MMTTTRLGHHAPPPLTRLLARCASPSCLHACRSVGREVTAELLQEGDVAAAADTSPGVPSFWSELWRTLTNPIYMSVVLGYAGYTGVVAGIGTFAPTFIVGLKLIDGQSEASLAAGAVVSIAGLIGVPVGGWMIDRGQRKARAALRQEQAIRAAARAAGMDENVAVAQAALAKKKGLLYVPPSAQLLAAAGATAPDAGAAADVAAAAAATAADASGNNSGAADDDEDATSPEVLDMKLNTALPQCTTLAFLGSVIIVGGVFATMSGLALFLVILATGTLILMGTTAGE